MQEGAAGAGAADEEMQDSTGGAVVAQSSPRKAAVRSPQDKPPNPQPPKLSRNGDGGQPQLQLQQAFNAVGE